MSPTEIPPALLAAQWYAGQSWRVEYLRPVPSPNKHPSPPPRPPEHSIWRYQVVSADRQRGLLQLLATQEDGDGKLELWFDLLLILRRVIKIVGSKRIELIRHAGADPYFGWSPSYPVIFDWPQIPDVEGETKREFVDDDGQPVEEVVHFLSPTQFETRMTTTRKIDAGMIESRHVTQVWAVGSPWWSNAVVATESVIDGVKSNEVHMGGRLIL